MPVQHIDSDTSKQAVDSLLACYEKVRSHIQARGGFPFRLSAGFDSTLSCTVRQGEVESIQSDTGYSLSLTMYQGSKRGHTSTNVITDSAIAETVDKAIALSAYAHEDEAALPVERELLANHFPPLAQRSMTVPTLDSLVEAARTMEAAAFAHDPRIINSEGSGAEYADAHQLFATHDDFCLVQASASCGAHIGVIAEEKDVMQPGWHWTHTFEGVDALNATELGVKATQDAISSLGAQPLATGEYSLLFTPQVATSLLGAFLSALDGHKLYKNTTFLQDALGEQLFPEWFTLIESPFLPQGWGSAHRDADGVGCTQKVIVADGLLQTHLYDCYAARKCQAKTTGNAGGVTNIELAHSEMTYDDLLQELSTGIVITHLMGDASNLLTGQYSRGAKGFFVKNGQVQHPVEGITLSSTFRDMFKNLRACGKDIDPRFKYLTGSWLIDKMVVAS